METVKRKKDLPLNYALVASVLREGKENSLTSTQIIQRLGWSDNSRRNVFHIINRLIEEHGYLIGSSRKGEHKGFFLISNHDEFMETVRTGTKQAHSELRKINKLKENYIRQSISV